MATGTAHYTKTLNIVYGENDNKIYLVRKGGMILSTNTAFNVHMGV